MKIDDSASRTLNGKLAQSYGWHVVMDIRNRLFKSKEAAIARIRNFEAEFKPFDGGWIINGPGADGMFRVHQGSVALEDIMELIASDYVALYRHGELVDWEEI